jgi:hypothetical protein
MQAHGREPVTRRQKRRIARQIRKSFQPVAREIVEAEGGLRELTQDIGLGPKAIELTIRVMNHELCLDQRYQKTPQRCVGQSGLAQKIRKAGFSHQPDSAQNMCRTQHCLRTIKAFRRRAANHIRSKYLVRYTNYVDLWTTVVSTHLPVKHYFGIIAKRLVTYIVRYSDI